MQLYLVGGAVRDALMGLPLRDRDWVAVGATPEQLEALGYQRVGRDFPVFLHPQTRDEVALARTERKTAPGYRGFVVHAEPNVTLEDDLARRDLTINAMAIHAELIPPDWAGGALPEGALVDPFGGQRDLQGKTLRHVTEAFHEDPVRILRVARFAARFADYTVAPETLDLMRRMVEHGEVDHLVSERVWQEVARGLMEDTPSRMLQVLRECGALARVLPEVDRLWGVPQSAEHHPEIDTGAHLLLVLDMAARLGADLPTRFACLTHDLGKGTTPASVLPRHLGHEGRSVQLLHALCQRMRVPMECSQLAEIVAREHGNLHRSSGLGAEALLRLLERCDALRKPHRFAQALLACECDARGRLGLQNTPYRQRARLQQALEIVLALPTQEIAQSAMERGASGPAVGRAIHAERCRVLHEWLQQTEGNP